MFNRSRWKPEGVLFEGLVFGNCGHDRVGPIEVSISD